MKQRGFSMLEVLVALLVVSIGLLGLAGLTAASIKNNQSAYQRSIASWLAYDILDRMRANRSVAQAGGYNLILGAAPGGGGVANTDLTQWILLLNASLPGAQGSVQPKGGGFEITVQWNDERGLGLKSAGGFVGNVQQQFLIQTQL